MKKLIILSGNSPRNQAWGEGVLEEYGPWFDNVYNQVYDHWASGSKDMNVEVELMKISEATREEADYYFIAKSMGSILTLLAISRSYVSPQKCVFFGMPLEIASEELFKNNWSPLETFSVPSIAYHNDEDPISYQYTKQVLEKYAPESIELVTMKGDNHDYLDFPDYEDRVKNFLEV